MMTFFPGNISNSSNNLNNSNKSNGSNSSNGSLRKLPVFQVKRRRLFSGWFGMLAVLLKHNPSRNLQIPKALRRAQLQVNARLPKAALFVSTILHFLFIFLLATASFAFLDEASEDSKPEVIPNHTIYYVKLSDLPKFLPRLLPPGPGGQPGRGTRPELPPALGSTALYARLTLVSNPKHPDNKRQTILQNSSVPDLKITEDVPLPSLLIRGPKVVAMPKPDFRAAAPVKSAERQSQDEKAPDLAADRISSDTPFQMAPAVTDVPRLPVAPASRPTAGGGSHGTGEIDAPSTLQGGPGAQIQGSDLVALGIDSSGNMQVLVVPGNRYGAFSGSPAGGSPGSPGGVPGGSKDGGTGGAGTGGDGSTGVGKGNKGGGGGGSGEGGFISINGTNGAGSIGELPPVKFSSLIYAIPPAPHIRKNSLVITAGPVGGGGLGVYGALHGRKIYTVYLPMPGRNWTLQYCARAAADHQTVPEPRPGVVNLDVGIVAPEADEKFDFLRTPVPKEKENKLIILRGIIGEDGRISELTVYQGLDPVLDQIALTAFGRWRFKPAIQAGKPASVEILVGIPARGPQKTE
jgi:hypothetical protein